MKSVTVYFSCFACGAKACMWFESTVSQLQATWQKVEET